MKLLFSILALSLALTVQEAKAAPLTQAQEQQILKFASLANMLDCDDQDALVLANTHLSQVFYRLLQYKGTREDTSNVRILREGVFQSTARIQNLLATCSEPQE